MKNLTLGQFGWITLTAASIGLVIDVLASVYFGLWLLEHRRSLGLISSAPPWHQEMMVFPALLAGLLVWMRWLHGAAGIERRVS